MSYQPADPAGAVLLAVQASQALAAAGQADMVWGHASVRDPGGRGAWMKSAGWGLEEIDGAKVILVGPDGSVRDGTGPRHIEYPIHTEIMAARPDVGSVVHTHSPAANEFAAPDAPAAVMTALLLDRACRTQLTAMAAGPLRRWGGEQDTVAKRADVWSDRQLQAGWEYLLRRGTRAH